MVRITMRDSRLPLSEQDIVRAEGQLGFALPKGYRSFLLAYNGGRPSPSVFPIFGDTTDEQGIVNWFYCIREGDMYDLLSNRAMFKDRIPPELLAIADDPGGNQICLAVSGAHAGKLFFWDHEAESDDGEPPTYDNLYLISDSFDEFVKSLKDESTLAA